MRNPYVIVTSYVAMKKFYNTTTTALTRETFTDLNAHWATLPAVKNSSTMVAVPKQKSYTKYSHPIFFGSRTIFSVKESLDTPAALVRTNINNGEQQRICYIGNLSTRPLIQGSRIWWTEYRR